MTPASLLVDARAVRPAALAAGAAAAAAWAGMAAMGHGSASVLQTSTHWALMCVAMMLPTVLPSLRTASLPVGLRIAGGYLVPWIAVAPLAWLAVSTVPTVLLCAAAAVWQVTSWRAAALRRCPDGGLDRGLWCLAACGPLMLALTSLAGALHSGSAWPALALMAAATMAMTLERRGRAITWEISAALLLAVVVLLGTGSAELPPSGHTH